jgi:uncharacterized protein YjbI with pentapeptide repeats
MNTEAVEGAAAEGTVFTDVNWGSVIESEFQGCTFVGADLSEAVIADSRFVDCHFQRSDLSLWKPTDSVIGGCVFEDCRMLGIDWTLASWPRVPLHEANAFARCNLSMGTFADLDLGPVRFGECRLRETSFRHARMAGADFGGSDCRGADFHGADLTGALLVGVLDLSVDPRSTKLEGARVDAVTGVGILELLGITLDSAEAADSLRER